MTNPTPTGTVPPMDDPSMRSASLSPNEALRQLDQEAASARRLQHDFDDEWSARWQNYAEGIELALQVIRAARTPRESECRCAEEGHAGDPALSVDVTPLGQHMPWCPARTPDSGLREELLAWVQKQRATPWSEGSFASRMTGEQGYDAALEELEARLR